MNMNERISRVVFAGFNAGKAGEVRSPAINRGYREAIAGLEIAMAASSLARVWMAAWDLGRDQREAISDFA